MGKLKRHEGSRGRSIAQELDEELYLSSLVLSTGLLFAHRLIGKISPFRRSDIPSTHINSLTKF